MFPRLLLDTHVVLRWVFEPNKLSREQFRVVQNAERRSEPVGLSAMSLLEIANMASEGRLKTSLDELFYKLESNPFFQVLPLDYEVAEEVTTLRSALRDPADCVIVATARIRALRLVTSDQRIIASKLVAVIE